jgi:hypothetical protein
LFRVGIYPRGNRVGAVWYDDPLDRESALGRNEKVQRYLERYGALGNWELRLDNGWNRHWFNAHDQVGLVYGIHKDVVRINEYREAHA